MDDRGWLRVCGVLFCVLAISNFMKPFELYPHHGFVFFGQRQQGTTNLLLGPLPGSSSPPTGSACCASVVTRCR